MNLKRRLTRVEASPIYHLAAEAGRPYGLSAQEVLAEARAFLALPPAAQRLADTELDAPTLTAEDHTNVTIEPPPEAH
jgi:hypothetical protein